MAAIAGRIFNLRQLSTTERIAATFGPAGGLPMCNQFFRPRATGRMEFSAKLLEFRNKIGHGGMRSGIAEKAYADLRGSVDRVMTGVTVVVIRSPEQRIIGERKACTDLYGSQGSRDLKPSSVAAGLRAEVVPPPGFRPGSE